MNSPQPIDETELKLSIGKDEFVANALNSDYTQSMFNDYREWLDYLIVQAVTAALKRVADEVEPDLFGHDWERLNQAIINELPKWEEK